VPKSLPLLGAVLAWAAVANVLAPPRALAESKVAADWTAWVDLQPPGPPSLHVHGTVEAPTPCHKASLSVRVPPGINPTILQLNLSITPPTGPCTQVVTNIPVAYDDQAYDTGKGYKTVQIFDGNATIATVEIDEVH